MSAKETFVLKALAKDANVSALCREFGISRKTGYKWLNRYKEKGLAGLQDVTRRPKTVALSAGAEVILEVIRIRKAHGWGSKKIRELIAIERPELKTPSRSTVHRILERSGFLQPGRHRKRRRSNGPSSPPRVVFESPNDLWTVDFKGWWLALNQERCEPLTIRDAFSRYVLEIKVLPTTAQRGVFTVFAEVFEKYGLPKAILTDNGPPFVATQGDLGLTQLSAWWTRLGIEHHRTRPGTPSDNGGHERMHRDMADDLETYRAYSAVEQQAACNRFRHTFNHHRPHEGIGMKRPGDLYARSTVSYSTAPIEPEYPDAWDVRRVQKRGVIGFLGYTIPVSWALGGQQIGLERLGEGKFSVWYFHRHLGEIVLRGTTPRFVPIKWREEAVVLPIAAL